MAPVAHADTCRCRVRLQACRARHVSILRGASALVASRRAPAEAENTEKFNGALMPKPMVIPSANANNSSPLTTATLRVWKPTIRARPHATSASVTIQPSVGIQALGREGFSCAVSARKVTKFPQATLLVPGGPHSPNRSVTAARKVRPKASRTYSIVYLERHSALACIADLLPYRGGAVAWPVACAKKRTTAAVSK